jgi:hypothetical protein
MRCEAPYVHDAWPINRWQTSNICTRIYLYMFVAWSLANAETYDRYMHKDIML